MMIPRGVNTVRFATSKSISDAMSFSGYSEIDFTIPETSPVYEAVQKFAAFNIGCLVTVDSAGTCGGGGFQRTEFSLWVLGNMTGVLSERDYICKIALLGRTSKETKCKEICTVAGKIITATSDESVETCMEKMMNHGIRHLPIVDDKKSVIGMVSIKDLVKTVVKEKEEAIKVLSDFALGKGGHFGSE